MLRPVVKWPGGKRYLQKRIIELAPRHTVYGEPYGGAASVLLNKPPVNVECYNDINGDLYNLFLMLREKGGDLSRALELTLYSQEEFDQAAEPTDDPIERARRFYVRCRQSFGGGAKSWSCTTQRPRGGKAGDVNAWWTAIDQLPEIIERLKRVQICNMEANDFIRKFDSIHTFFYLDPPYVGETKSGDNYLYEMTDEDHVAMAAVVKARQGKFAVSGYKCDLYDHLFHGWRRVDFDIANHASGGRRKARETESIWMNY